MEALLFGHAMAERKYRGNEHLDSMASFVAWHQQKLMASFVAWHQQKLTEEWPYREISALLIWACGQEFSEKDSDRVSGKDSRIYPARALCWPCSVKRLTCQTLTMFFLFVWLFLIPSGFLFFVSIISCWAFVLLCLFASLVCAGAIVQKSFDTSFPSTYLQGQLRANLSQEREERYQDCSSCGCTFRILMSCERGEHHYMMLCLFHDVFFIDHYLGFYCSTIEIRWVAESNKLAWLDSQRSRRFLEESLQSGRKYGWMAQLFFNLTLS